MVDCLGVGGTVESERLLPACVDLIFPPALLRDNGATMPRLRTLIVFQAALMACSQLQSGAIAADPEKPTPEQIQFFESQIRPVLVENCNGCHSATKIKAGLRLDSRTAALTGGESGPSIVPGKPDESPLIAAVRYEGPEMPPKGKLSVKQVEALILWVKMGAPWPASGKEPSPASASVEPASNIRKPGYGITDQDRAHWSFKPVVRPKTPNLSVGSLPLQPIDAFIQQALDGKGLKPNPIASRQALIRRVTFDLTGLPPSPAEVEAFLADPAADAYEKLVDRLLASPRYGEKWGRNWLDLVRFAETNSYERDGVKPNAWRYRDYVIRSFNDDKPYDRFIREQLAGDEIPDGGSDALIATGYYRLGLWDDEPADRDQARYDSLDDIVGTTSQVFLGLTVDCARCHDHKLDPIPQKDYYRFLSFFQNINQYRNGGPTDEATLFASAQAEEVFKTASRELTQKRDDVQSALTTLEEEFRAGVDKKEPQATSPDIDDLTYRYFRDTWDEIPDFDALKPESVGKLPDGLFDLSPKTREVSFGFVFEGTLIVPRDGWYTFQLESDDGARLLIDDTKVVERDGIHKEKMPREGSITLKKGRLPIRLEYFQAMHGYGLRLKWSGPGVEARSLTAPSILVSEEGVTPRVKSKTLNQADIAKAFRTQGAAILGEIKAKHYRELRKELDELKRRKVTADRALVVTEAGPVAPETRVLLRGNPRSPGEKVEPAFIQVVTKPISIVPQPTPSSKTSGRRTVLADWIASPDNPLTARVMANRVWQYHFGRGITRSPNNLGQQGDKPTHPELLDWLAAELIADGWRLKPLHRLILTSDVYKRSSQPEANALAVDPTNDQFWRFDMRRLTAEEIRDSILSVTGALNLKMYGPGVYPEIPAEVMAGQSVPGAGWHTSPLAEQNRRSIYVHIKRSLILPILESYDLAETDRSSPVRFATTQPTQALGMLNGGFMNGQSRALAERLRREAGPDLTRQVEQALILATSRKPTEIEVRRGINLITKLEAEGSSKESALESFCLIVLNLDEFIYLD